MNNQEVLNTICEKFKERFKKWTIEPDTPREFYIKKCSEEVKDIMDQMEINHLHLPMVIKMDFVDDFIDIGFFLQTTK